MGDERGDLVEEVSGWHGLAQELRVHRALGGDDPTQALVRGEPARAVAAFWRALYTDPTFALAAFTLGCAHDALGDKAAARRAYEQALRTLDPADTRHELLLQQIDIGDIAAACQTRLNWRQGS